MGKNNKQVNYNISNFNFTKSQEKKLEKMAKRLDILQDTNHYSVTFKEAINNKDIFSVNEIYSKANEINEKYKGSITNTASFRTMKNRQARQFKHKKLNESKGRKTSGYTKYEFEEFADFIGELFGDFSEMNNPNYYDSEQKVGLAYIIKENSTGDFKKDLKAIQKEAKRLNISLTRSPEMKELIQELYKKYNKSYNRSYYENDF